MQTRTLIVAFVASLCALPAAAQLQSKHQIRCLKELWKAGVQVSQAQGADNVSCFKSSTAGRLAPMTTGECLAADMKKRVLKKQARAIAIAGDKCAVESPTYGATDPETVSSVSSGSQIGLVTDLFGVDLESALIPCSQDKAGCRCQVKSLKAAVDLAVKQLKHFAGCTKRALKVNTLPFLGGVLSTSELERCLFDGSTPWSVVSDERGKMAKAASKLSAVIAKTCGGVSYFPGTCVAESGEALVNCVEDRVDCNTCLAINQMYALGVDCDSYDNGATDLSCK